MEPSELHISWHKVKSEEREKTILLLLAN